MSVDIDCVFGIPRELGTAPASRDGPGVLEELCLMLGIVSNYYKVAGPGVNKLLAYAQLRQKLIVQYFAGSQYYHYDCSCLPPLNWT